MKAEDLSKALLITCSAAGIAFAVGYPFHISTLKFLSPGGPIYSPVFWCVLFAAMVGIRVIWQGERPSRLWKAVLRGIVMGYVSSLVAYIALVSSARRLENLLEKPTDILYVLMFLVVTCGWLLGAVAGLFEYLGDRYFQRASVV